MDAENTLLVHQRVRNFLKEWGNRAFNIDNRNQFNALLHFVRECPELAEVEADDLEVEILTCLLGPDSPEIPPCAMRTEIRHLLSQGIPDGQDPRERRIEVITAYGLGKGRVIKDGEGDWQHRWTPAHEWLTRRVFVWIWRTVKWLRFGLKLEGAEILNGLFHRDKAASLRKAVAWARAQEIASHLWSGTCDCSRLRKDDTDQPPTRAARERAARCLRKHRLSVRNLRQPLWTYIAEATKGPATENATFASGAVTQGMFFGHLYRDYDVRFGPVLGWRCPRHAENLAEGPEGSQCPQCEQLGILTRFDRKQHYRDAERRLLIKSPTGPYEQEEYWHCQECENYYPANDPVCPRGGHGRTPGAAKSNVWVRGAAAVAASTVQVRSKDGTPRIIDLTKFEQVDLSGIDPEFLVELKRLAERLKDKKKKTTDTDIAEAMGIDVAQVPRFRKALKLILKIWLSNK